MHSDSSLFGRMVTGAHQNDELAVRERKGEGFMNDYAPCALSLLSCAKLANQAAIDQDWETAEDALKAAISAARDFLKTIPQPAKVI